MKKNIFIYLFVFAALIAIFQYVNTRGIFAMITAENKHLREIKEELKDSISHINNRLEECNKYSLGKSGEAFYQEIGIENPEKWILDKLMETNPEKGNNSLINFHSGQSGFHIYEAKILNHRWIIAGFTDGEFNGQALLEYDIDEHQKITFKEVSEVIFPKSYSVVN